MKELVVKLLKKALKEKRIKLKDEEIEKLLEVPPTADMGDYAFPCFFLAERLKEEPKQIALEIREKIGNAPTTDFEDIQTAGPYVNFFFNRKSLAKKLVWEVITKKKDFGRSKIGEKKKIVVEFSAPNIAKPFGIGHLRSTIIGNSIANICEFQGFKPIRLNYLGDWGAQFGRLLVGYKKFGDEKKLQKNPIKHLLEIYVKSNKKSFDKQSAEEFKKLEDGDKENVMLWRTFKEYSLEEFDKVYKELGIKFDKQLGESMYNKKMKEIIKELKEKKLLEKSEGAQIVNLKEHNLGACLIEKSDGATLYATRDLASAIDRHSKYNFEKMIYEVGQEQKLHFKQVFKVLELMGYKWAKNCIHVEHGHYLGKDGKKFSTRKGKSVFLKDILNETKSLAKKEIKKRLPKIKEKELEKRAHKIAIAAIFYGDLKNNRKNNIVFDIKKFVSFEGDTGPYIQYSYARASSIQRKAESSEKFKVNNLDPQEIELIRKLLQFPDVVSKAYNSLSPSIIANYTYKISKLFNEFYHACPVIGSESEMFRLALVEAFRQIIKNCAYLLGIELLEKM
ncbi:arginine--tRNA ligase [Candidatus Pacearchaeota archaeon]|nr:arginine--tRNA ligase [Candidatus Pacearchaeota archaeon]